MEETMKTTLLLSALVLALAGCSQSNNTGENANAVTNTTMQDVENGASNAWQATKTAATNALSAARVGATNVWNKTTNAVSRSGF